MLFVYFYRLYSFPSKNSSLLGLGIIYQLAFSDEKVLRYEVTNGRRHALSVLWGSTWTRCAWQWLSSRLLNFHRRPLNNGSCTRRVMRWK